MIKRILSERTNKKIVYLGDGAGDYCSAVQLRDGDHVLPRKNFPVWDLIRSNPSLIKAEIHEWSDGVDFEQVLLSTIQDIISKGDYNIMAPCLASDCKLDTIPIVLAHQGLPKALHVHF